MRETLASKRMIQVLIVDDEPLFRLGLAAVLAEDERLEFIVSEAGDGEVGLARIAAEEPPVVLLDLNMPRLDGHAVLRQVKERWPQIRVIVLTASDSVEDRWRAEQVGVDAFVEKRHAHAQLSALIASL
ncbi:MAG: response regulator [Actinobacteria bacterium]|nr:MAG: response regulator [Actinomycetota bacterium]